MVNLAWTAVRVVVMAAPFVLHIGTRDVAPMLGSSTFPDWTVVGSFGAALAALVLAVHDLLLLRGRSNEGLWIRCAVATVIMTPFAALLLYSVIDLLAAILALPYSAAFVTTVYGGVRRWDRGRDIPEG